MPPNAFTKLSSPGDLGAVTALAFNVAAQNLLVASVNTGILLYDCNQYERQETQFHINNVILSMAVDGSGSVYVGTDTGAVGSLDLENLKLWEMADELGVCSSSPGLDAVAGMGVIDSKLFAAKYNGNFLQLDPRQAKAVQQVNLEHKVFAMDVSDTYVVLGMEAHKVHIYDSRKFDQPVQRRETGLKHQTSDIRCFPNGKGYALATIDGRVAVEYFDVSAGVQARKYAFKCHRTGGKNESEDTVYPVNALEFDQNHDSILYTAGSDGAVCTWDWHGRRRIKQHSGFSGAVTKMQICGPTLAVAVCDDSYRVGKRATRSSELYVMG
ncbi:hypothetical protein QFC19_007164 [Naganishia cerealis]|uniref:Uncharacterized protein n=1 Tax=Naganishia cerealis TaxID=610337 RepID=A0ACC2VC61_9TREE|nr:hypothetical protein QFC19_007164 [Naganishia cerealis]